MEYLNKIKTGFIKNYNERKERLYRDGLRKYLFNSKGYVLIFVLMITTLLMMMASDFLVLAKTTNGYFRKIDARTKASYLARSGIDLAVYVLKMDKKGMSGAMFTGKTTDKNIDCYDDLWAMDFPAIPIEQGFLKIKITDENSKINVSALANQFVEQSTYYGIVQRFFLNMELPIDLADVIIDWVDPDDSRFPYGAESADYYQTLVPPYSATNTSMDSIDEMLMLKDFTPEIYYGLSGDEDEKEQDLVDHNMGKIAFDMSSLSSGNTAESTAAADDDEEVRITREKSRRLSDYFRVHGDRDNYMHDYNKININTASFRVLSALTDDMTDDIVTDIIGKRQNTPFKSVTEVNDVIEDTETLNNILGVKSYIFKIITIASINNTNVKITAVYNRDKRMFLYWCEQ